MLKKFSQNFYICFSTQLKSQNTMEFPPETINQFKVSKAFFNSCKIPNKPNKTNSKCLRSHGALTSMVLQVCCLEHCSFSPSCIILSSHTERHARGGGSSGILLLLLFSAVSHLPKLLILSQKSLSPLDLIYVMITNSHVF